MPEPIVVNGIPATRTQEVYDFKEKSHKNPIFFFFLGNQLKNCWTKKIHYSLIGYS